MIQTMIKYFTAEYFGCIPLKEPQNQDLIIWDNKDFVWTKMLQLMHIKSSLQNFIMISEIIHYFIIELHVITIRKRSENLPKSLEFTILLLFCCIDKVITNDPWKIWTWIWSKARIFAQNEQSNSKVCNDKKVLVLKFLYTDHKK